MKIAFVSDSGCGKSVKDLAAEGIYSVPLQISVEQNNYRDIEELSIEEAYKHMREGKMLSTSLASIGEIENLFTTLKEEGYEMIFAVPISSGLSGTMQAMQTCAERVGIKLELVESYVTAIVQEYMLKVAIQLFNKENKTIEEVKTVLNNIVHTTNTIILPSDLKHLKRSGRLTPIAATLAGLLKIQPILHINENTKGKVDVLDKVRTESKALSKAIEIMKKDGVDETYDITIAQADCQENAIIFRDLINQTFPNNKIDLIPLVSVVGVHTGRGCLAVQYFKKIA